jgi:hypothetical protein
LNLNIKRKGGDYLETEEDDMFMLSILDEYLDWHEDCKLLVEGIKTKGYLDVTEADNINDY